MNVQRKYSKTAMLKLLQNEDTFISNLLIQHGVPDAVEEDTDFDNEYLLPTSKQLKDLSKISATNRAQNPDELQQRFESLKNKMNSKKSKPSERAVKKRQLKKLKKDKNLKHRIINVAKSTKNAEIKEIKLLEDNKDLVKRAKLFNEEGKIVFSKFEFAAQKSKAKKSKKEKTIKNPRLILQHLKKQAKNLSELIEQGNTDQVIEIKQELAWKKVFDRTEGKKVKDDPSLLRKTIKRTKEIKKKSKLQWKQRQEFVKKDIEARQKKRQENIDKRKEDKRKSKLKKMAKRGRIIPGYG